MEQAVKRSKDDYAGQRPNQSSSDNLEQVLRSLISLGRGFEPHPPHKAETAGQRLGGSSEAPSSVSLSAPVWHICGATRSNASASEVEIIAEQTRVHVKSHGRRRVPEHLLNHLDVRRTQSPTRPLCAADCAASHPPGPHAAWPDRTRATASSPRRAKPDRGPGSRPCIPRRSLRRRLLNKVTSAVGPSQPFTHLACRIRSSAVPSFTLGGMCGRSLREAVSQGPDGGWGAT